jgi:hypothetical protein
MSRRDTVRSTDSVDCYGGVEYLIGMAATGRPKYTLELPPQRGNRIQASSERECGSHGTHLRLTFNSLLPILDSRE